MTKEEFKQKYNRAAADAGSFSRLTLNEDEIQDFYVDNQNRIYLCDSLTPYDSFLCERHYITFMCK